VLNALWNFFGRRNTLRARDIVGNAIVGDVNGLVIQQIGAGPLPEPPAIPWRDLPASIGTHDEIEIFNLLTWRTRLSQTLIGRDADRDNLLAWAGSDRRFAIRVLSGEGGAGKSRLAAEIADQLRGEQWIAGLIRLDTTHTLPITRKGLFLAIDYPEDHRSTLQAIFRSVAAREQRSHSVKAPIRLLLLGRQPLSWWFNDLVETGASELCDSQDCSIGPLGATDTTALVRTAAIRLATNYKLSAPHFDDTAVDGWHAREPALHGLPLFATAAALHAVLDPGPTFQLGGREIVRALVLRERTRLDRAAKGAGWQVPEAASRLHALAALRRELDEPALRALAEATPAIGLPAADRIVDQIRRIGWWRGTGLQPPQPDLVAAELLHQTLGERPDPAPAWLAATLGQQDTLEVERIGRLAHDIATLNGDNTDALVRWLIRAVQSNAALADTWRAFLDSDLTTFRLAPLAIAVGQSLLTRPDLDEERRAGLLNDLSVELGSQGDNPAALTAIEAAVAIRRRLAAANPARFEPDLVRSLNNWSIRLSGAGDNPAALTVIEEAVAIWRRLAVANPAPFEPDLASGLNNLSSFLREAGDDPAALTAIEAAVAIRRRLAAANPARFEPDLASSLNNLSNRLSDAGDNPAALTAIEAAVAIYRRLAAANPARFEPDLTSILNNVSNRLSDAGDNPAALTAIEEAVAIRRRLAAANPARFEPDLAGSLINLSIRLSGAGDNPAALTAIEAAVAIYRRLAATNPARFEPDLASSLNNQSNSLSEAGDNPAALTAIEAAVAIYRRLAAANPARFEPDLASSLSNLSILLSDARDNPAALTAIEAAVAIHRRLAAANPARFEPDLAGSLNNLSNRLGDTGDDPAALTAIEAAVAIFRRLAAANPARFEPDLARSLNNLSNRLGDTGDDPAALTAIEAAVAIRRRLAAGSPARFEPDLAGSLNNLSIRLSGAGDNPAALTAIEAAVAIRRRLAAANPARFELDLAQSLNNLSNRLGDTGDNPAALTAIEAAVAIYRRLAAANPARFEPDLARSLAIEKNLRGPA
jgi:Tetratricopeptide repeat